MACEAIRTWSFSTLVGAFLDLALAYLLLCCSALAFFAVKFLSFFGLSLPCPCNGLFGDPYADRCLQQFLVDAPVQRIADVHTSVRCRFPFDTIWDENRTSGTHRQLNVVKFALEEDRGGVGAGFLELRGGEESCSSLSEARASRSSTSTLSRGEEALAANGNSCVGRRGRGKGVLHQRPPLGLRRRRRAAADYGKYSAVSSSSDAAPTPPLVARDRGHEKGKDSIFSNINSGENGLQGENSLFLCLLLPSLVELKFYRGQIKKTGFAAFILIIAATHHVGVSEYPEFSTHQVGHTVRKNNDCCCLPS